MISISKTKITFGFTTLISEYEKKKKLFQGNIIWNAVK